MENSICIETLVILVTFFQGSFDRVKENLDRSERDQSLMRTHEARDRNIVESNFERVNWWSSIQLFVMISVSLVQV